MISQNSARPQIPRELTRLQPWRWFVAMIGDWLFIVMIFVVFAICGKPIYLLPVVVLLIGSRQHALAILGHEGAHFLIVRNRRVNDFVSQFFISWPLLICIADGYRPWHFEHHRHLGSATDPELSYRDAPVYRGRVTWMRVIKQFFGDLFGCGTFGALTFLQETFPSKRRLVFLIPITLWAFCFVTFGMVGLLWIPLLWSVSIITGFYSVFRVRTFSEHVGVPKAGKETSHRFHPGTIFRFLFFPHNTWCHYEHHKWPQVPYYNLPKLRKLDSTKPILPLSELFPLA